MTKFTAALVAVVLLVVTMVVVPNQQRPNPSTTAATPSGVDGDAMAGLAGLGAIAGLAEHDAFTVTTSVQACICAPRSPMQRGSNEYTIGLLRKHLSRSMDSSTAMQAKLHGIAEQRIAHATRGTVPSCWGPFAPAAALPPQWQATGLPLTQRARHQVAAQIGRLVGVVELGRLWVVDTPVPPAGPG